MSNRIQHMVGPRLKASRAVRIAGAMLAATRAGFQPIEAAEYGPDVTDTDEAEVFAPGMREAARAPYLAPLAIAAVLLFVWAGLCAI